MCLLTAGAQEKYNSLSTPFTTPLDTIDFANNIFKEGFRIGGKDTSKSFRLLSKAAQLFNLTGHALEEGKCYLNIGDIIFEEGNYNRSLGNYRKAADVLYEVS